MPGCSPLVDEALDDGHDLSASQLRPTTRLAKASRLCSSTMFSNFSLR
jgi:hypothetical protein